MILGKKLSYEFLMNASIADVADSWTKFLLLCTNDLTDES